MAVLHVVPETTKPGLIPVGEEPQPPSYFWQIPPSNWTPLCHPNVVEVSRDVDDYFMRKWVWPNERAKKVFIAAGFSRVTCLYFPLALDDRIALACKLLAVLFLVDDELEDMNLEDGKKYNESLIQTSKGEIEVDQSKPAQVILDDIWRDMLKIDNDLAESVKEPVFTFMRAQTDRERLNMKGLGHYLQYREADVGKALLSALMRFSMGLHLTPDQQSSVRALEQNCSRQISIVNDIYSWEKEYKASQMLNAEGAVLCSGVKLVSEEAGLDFEASKRVLWSMAREWERVHDSMAQELLTSVGANSEAMKLYIKGLEYQMSGNELWSKTTPRYHNV
ncbi:Aristolochene synthase from penicillium Roqueforti [Melanomma pulvis-pyrius CBS 109.77]|uniref:Terpene synthase n=1 Tax=Melanomma pulvis-pyrius CBS 109.77 TaxID=1314802 RepID=A0A6A6XKZ7_9PLEO|nr:Aristolochene synthase from penicillium Roqueforti [Melanomma pulvis-pyrius CBS 109.77]